MKVSVCISLDAVLKYSRAKSLFSISLIKLTPVHLERYCALITDRLMQGVSVIIGTLLVASLDTHCLYMSAYILCLS